MSPIKIGNKYKNGFTLVELLVVMVIIGLLLSKIVPSYFKNHIRAKETVLRQNLQTLRIVIDDYQADHGTFPTSLLELVNLGYIRELPLDPITGKNDSWTLVLVVSDSKPEVDDGLANLTAIRDINSGAQGNGLDGSPYASW